MENKVFVGNLAYSVSDTDLQELFERQGTVKSANVICDKSTGRSRGYGFVEMSSEDEARRAIETLNGTQLEGRTLIVNPAHPQERRTPGSVARQDSAPFARPIQNSERLVLHRHRRIK
jgi:cold-inducible RNA-binding protein